MSGLAETPKAKEVDKEHMVPMASASAKAGRLTSLDVFRGVTVAGMILANNGSGESYAPLHHAEWNGWTPTDLIFPSFLFIVGVSITFALSKRMDAPDVRRSLLIKIFRRGLIIFALGIALAGFPNYNWSTIRIPGVLQRIALCYLAASLIFLVTKVRGQIIAAASLLIGYAALMRYANVPEFGAGDWARGHDLGSYLDRLLLPGHIYKSDYDPEGLLSTLPSIATTLLGILAGHWLRSGRDRYATCSGLFVFGTLAIIAGSSWGAWFPINKALWTSSFVLLAGGWSMLGLAVCSWLVDVQNYRRWAAPFRVLGTNPIVAYTLAAVGARLLNTSYLKGEGDKLVSVHHLYYGDYLAPNLSAMNASLAYAGSILVACILIVWIMDLLHLHVRA